MSMTATGAKRLDIGNVVADTFGVISDNLATLALADVLLLGLPGVIQILGLKMIPTAPVSGGALAFLGGLGGLVGMLVLQGAVIYSASEDHAGAKASLGDLAAVGLRNALPLLGLFILIVLGVSGGLILLVVPGVLLALRWSLSAPVLITERQGVLKSMKRSAELTQGHRWSIFLLFLMVFLVMIVLEFALFALFGGLQGLVAARRSTASSIVSVLINMLIIPFNSALVAALFNTLRTQKEGTSTARLTEVFA
jgi:hypothetical protein